VADTLDQVAKIAGVSRATVSRVVNNSPKVSPRTREKVKKAIKESGYKPDAVARSLAKNETGIVGLVIPESVSRLFSDPFFAPFIQAVTEKCNDLDYELMLSLLTTPDREKEQCEGVVSSSFLDGFLFASSTVEDPLVDELLSDGTPFISVGRHPNEEVNFVDVDNYGGAKRATEYLLNLDHERIAAITGPLDQAAGIDRLKGYKDALREAGMEPEEGLIVEGDFTEESGVNGAQTLLANFPTAIIAANDMTAIGALKAVKKSGKSVPEDIAIVGFDDVASATAVEPPLTTVRQPIRELGRQATSALHQLIHESNPGDGSLRRDFLETELVVRSST